MVKFVLKNHNIEETNLEELKQIKRQYRNEISLLKLKFQYYKRVLHVLDREISKKSLDYPS